MRLTSIETFSTKDICHVRITDETGAQGWGMTAPFSADISAQVLHRAAAGIALRPYEDYTTVADDIMNEQYKYLGTFLSRAAAGIDTALWDLEAKRKGLSVAKLAGQKRDAIDLYASSMKRDLPVQEEADRLRALQDKYGYRAIKLHPSIPVGKDKDFWPNRCEDMTRAMIKTAVPGSEIYIDMNGNYSVERAIEMGKFFKDEGVTFYEEPCPYWDTDATKAVREACAKFDLPVAGGEQDYIDTIWNRMIDTRVMDICQPDLLYIGGFTRALRVAKRAAEHGLSVTPHTSNQSPIFVMGLHYMACIDTPYPFLECGIEDDRWALDCYTPNPPIADGRASVPTAPGWGYEPSPEFLAKARYAVSK